MKNGGKWIRFAVGILVSVFFMWLVLRRVEWRAFRDAILTVDLAWMAVGLGCLVMSYIINAFRWNRMFIQHPPGSGTTFSFIMIGFLLNSFLPFRMGDLLRGALLGRRTGIPVALVYGTMTLERLLDVTALLVIAAGVSLWMDLPPVMGRTLLVLTALGVMAFGGLLAFLLVERLRKLFLRLLTPFAALRRLAERVLENYLQGVRTVARPKALLALTGMSLLSWGVVGGAYLAFFKAFHLSVPWLAAYLALVLVNLGSAIPSSPGFVGVYHYMIYLALAVWIQDQSVIASFAVVTHLTSMALYAVLGGACLFRESHRWGLPRA